MKKLFVVFFSSIFVIFFVTSASVFTDGKDFKSEVAGFVKEKMKESDIPGLTFAFVDMDKNLVWTEGFGYADIAKQVTVTDKTLFKIASISKTFTAMALMQLCEAGKISLDDPLVKYVPDFTIKPHPARGGRAEDITLDMLTKHRSGILGDNMPGSRTTGNVNKNFMNHLPDIFSDMYLGDAPPSTFGAYSNAGIALLGYVVAKVGEPDLEPFDGFVKYTEENLFQKMNMDMTSFIIKDNMLPYISKGYDKDGSEKPMPFVTNALPAGSIHSNAQDMAKYMQTILNKGKNVLRPETLETMLMPEDTYQSIDNSDNIGKVWMSQYPFGREYPIRTHNGSGALFYSTIMIMPEQNIGVFVSVNSAKGNGFPSEITRYVLKKALEEKSGKAINPLVRRLQTAAVKMSKEEMMKYVGFYVDTESSREIVIGDDNRLYLRLAEPNMRTRDFLLTCHNDGTFVTESGKRFFFTGTGKDMVMYDMMNGEKRNPAVRKEKPVTPAFFEHWRGVWRTQNIQDVADDEEGLSGGLPIIIFGVREGVPYCMQRPIRFVDENTCYWEIYGRTGGVVMKKLPNGDIISRGIIYKKMR